MRGWPVRTNGGRNEKEQIQEEKTLLRAGRTMLTTATNKGFGPPLFLQSGSASNRPKLLIRPPLAYCPGCHLPPGIRKSNKIEHRMFCHLTQNWRGKPLESLAVIVELISHATTAKELRIRAEIDMSSYPKGKRISDEEMALVQLRPDPFHGEWNYAISPHTTT
jgi:DDE family transposase